MACPACGFAVAPAAKFCAECGQRLDTSAPPVQAAETFPAPQAYTPRYLAEKILTSRHALEGEPKQVTVLFADIKGSTELIEGLDPEEARRLLDPALHVMMDAVHRFEGTVNQVLGDGIMALFGAPIAHEDHALRACYAALAMQAAMQSYADEVRRAHGLTLRIRVGLNSGEVVVRAIGNDLHMDYSAWARPRIWRAHGAARSARSTAAGGANPAAGGGFVRVNAQVPFPSRADAAVEVRTPWASAVRRRLQATAARGLTRFVGATQRSRRCIRRWSGLRRHGQVVACVGEAGMGKSRLVYEVVHPTASGLAGAGERFGVLRQGDPLFPVIDLLKRYARVRITTTPARSGPG
jgi:class 3 adenylate cyclase